MAKRDSATLIIIMGAISLVFSQIPAQGKEFLPKLSLSAFKEDEFLSESDPNGATTSGALKAPPKRDYGSKPLCGDEGNGALSCKGDNGADFSTTCQFMPELCRSHLPPADSTKKEDSAKKNDLGPATSSPIPAPEPELKPAPEAEISRPETLPDPKETKPKFFGDNSILDRLPRQTVETIQKEISGMIEAAKTGLSKLEVPLSVLIAYNLKAINALFNMKTLQEFVPRLDPRFAKAPVVLIRPKMPIKYLWLRTQKSEGVFPPLIRDAAIARHCLARMHHEEMMASCISVPFDQINEPGGDQSSYDKRRVGI